MTIHTNIASLFFAAASIHPEREALALPDASLTYRQLEARVQRLRSQLDSTRDGPVFGVLAHRSETTFAGVLAVLAAGGAYVPLNPGFPALRNRDIAQKAGLRALIVGPECVGSLRELLAASEASFRVVTLEREPLIEALGREFPNRLDYAAPTPAPNSLQLPASATHVSDNALAYILFTSGSTGKPKGVLVRHANVHSYVQSFQRLYPIYGHDRLSQMFDLTFDLSVHDMFVTWSAGATLVVYPSSALSQPITYTRQQRVSVWFSVPSVAAMLDNLRQAEPGALNGLRLSLFCGEQLTWNTWQVWRSVAPRSRIVNLYGPTETTIAITHFEVPDDFPEHAALAGVVPIGCPFPGQGAEVRREDGSCCGVAEPGALWLCGDQLSAGYLEEPQLTAERFPADGGRRWYRTGDRALRDASNRLCFAGREDTQVKIMGYRVELGEVEHALMQVSGATFAMADIALRDGIEELYAVLPTALASEKQRIREALARLLPGYMLPRRYIFASDLPRNANGKLDRSAVRQRFSFNSKALAPSAR
jgi:amino acid adenylation domain-containing protein